MAKAAITTKYSLNGCGIIDINEEGIFLENTETGEAIDFRTLLRDFNEKTVKISVNFDKDYD